MNFNLPTFWTGLMTLCNLIAIAVLAALGHPIPTILDESLVGLVGGHLALSSPATPPSITSAAPRAPPASTAAVSAVQPAPTSTAVAAGPTA